MTGKHPEGFAGPRVDTPPRAARPWCPAALHIIRILRPTKEVVPTEHTDRHVRSDRPACPTVPPGGALGLSCIFRPQDAIHTPLSQKEAATERS